MKFAQTAEMAVQTLTAQLAAVVGTGSSLSRLPPEARELGGVPALMREFGVGFPARESFRAWYQRATVPDVGVSTWLTETVSGILAALFAGDQDEGDYLSKQLQTSPRWQVRLLAVQALAQGWPDERTRALLTDRATTDDRESVRWAAVQALAQGWPDERTRALLTDLAPLTRSGASGGWL